MRKDPNSLECNTISISKFEDYAAKLNISKGGKKEGAVKMCNKRPLCLFEGKGILNIR
jgi:hypothetical protein